MALNIISNVQLDMKAPNTVIVYANQYDSAGSVRAQLLNSGESWAVPAGAKAVVMFKKSDNIGGFYDVTEFGVAAVEIDSDRSVIYINYDPQVLTTAGRVAVQINFYQNDQRLSSFAFYTDVQASAVTSGEIASSWLFNILSQEIAQTLTVATTPQAMTDWLEANITQETGYVIDNTLTVAGAASDAQATGKMVTVSNTNPNTVANKVWVKKTPAEIQIPTMEDVDEVKSALVDWANIVNNVQYYGLFAVQGGPGAVPANTPTYLIGYNANSSSANYKRIIYYNGTAWANFEYKTIDDLPIDISSQEKIIDLATFKDMAQNPILWTKDMSKYLMSTANLFNKVDTNIILSHYISGSGYPEDANYNVSGYIPVDDSTAYSYKIYPSLYGSNANRLQCFDADKNRIGYSTGVITNGINTATPNSGTKYVRVAVAVSDMDSFMFVEGNSYPVDYIPYRIYIFGHESPLYRKKLCCEGDSIMRGAGNNNISFADMIAKANEMTLNKNAVSGATICSGTVDSQGNPKHWISTAMSSLDTDGDYYIFDGFVNDVNTSTVMGTITYGYNNTLDTATFCGAFEQCCKTLVTNFPGKKYGYVFVHRLWNMNDTLANTFIDNILKILNKWGVPYINLMDEIPSLNLIDTLKSAYTDDGDGWHPNEAGYKKYYCDKITAWLETL